VYDFYGFPKNYYEQKFASRGNPELLKDVMAALKASGVQVSTAKRGLDHGVWGGSPSASWPLSELTPVPFLVAFAGKTDIPIVQVSLPGDSSPVSAAKLGKALAALRDEGYGIMGTGQAVHNLRDYMMGGGGSYGDAFLHAIEGALHSDSPADGAIGLFRHPAYRQAHPTPEHLLPLVVAAAAADPKTDALQDIFVQPNGPLGWGMWMWKPKAAL
jgi:aromatic ring-opening dioxygenase catalytic subunit (LigB family)